MQHARTGRQWLAPRVEPAVTGVRESARRIVHGPQPKAKAAAEPIVEPDEQPGRVHRFVSALRGKLPRRSATKAA